VLYPCDANQTAWLTAILAMNGSSLAVLGILLPTLIHVSLFTLIFMVLGAIGAGSKMQAVLVLLYLMAIAILLVLPPSAETQVPAFAKVAQQYFGNVAPALGRLLGIAGLTLDTRLTSLLALVYLSLFELVYQSGGDPLDRYFENATGADRGRERNINRALFLRLYIWLHCAAGLEPGACGAGIPLNSLAVRQLGTAIGRGVVQRVHRRA
jgi:hypothetical protein